MQRRTLLKLGLGATVVMVLAGGGAALVRPGVVEGRLTEPARSVMHAVARAVLDGVLPKDWSAQQRALLAHLERLDSAIAAFPLPTQAELSQLLALLAVPPGRLALVGLSSAWPDANVTELQSALQGMRMATVTLKQQAYHALRDLTNAAYFSDASAWLSLGYPGPAAI